jgi:hypothetical protein
MPHVLSEDLSATVPARLAAQLSALSNAANANVDASCERLMALVGTGSASGANFGFKSHICL